MNYLFFSFFFFLFSFFSTSVSYLPPYKKKKRIAASGVRVCFPHAYLCTLYWKSGDFFGWEMRDCRWMYLPPLYVS